MVVGEEVSLWPKPHYPHVLAYPRHPSKFIAIAGPCSIESRSQAAVCADWVSRLASRLGGCQVYMRGGVYRAGTYPPREFGLQKHLLSAWSGEAKSRGLRIVVEVLDIRQVDLVDRYCDAFQVGARQGQGYALLRELAKSAKPVFLKNGAGMRLDEILGAAEYLARGRCKPRIVIRGSASFHDHVRWDMSISLIPAIKRLTGIPVVGDPSHGTGRRELVRPMGLAAVAAGADGLLVEAHPQPARSLSDARQALSLEDGERLLVDGAKMRGWPWHAD